MSEPEKSAESIGSFHSSIEIENEPKFDHLEKEEFDIENVRQPRLSIPTISLLDEYARNLYKIREGVAKMERMYIKLGGKDDSHENRAILNEVTEDTKNLILGANSHLKDIEAKSDFNDVQKMRLGRMTRDFQVTLDEFQDLQKKILKRSQDFIVRSKKREAEILSRSSKATSPEAQPLIEDKEAEEDTVQEQVLEEIDDEIAFNEAIVEERNQGIREIEAEIEMIQEIFLDIELLVQEQADPINTFEANIEASAARTEAALGELEHARAYHQKKRGNLCFSFFIFTLLLIVIMLIIWTV